MYKFLKPYWALMSTAKLIAHLKRGRYPNEFIRNAVNELSDVKESMRKSRIKNTVTSRLWHFLLSPARTELAIVRTMKSSSIRQNQPEQKYAALSAYEDVIMRVIAKLRKAQRLDEITPAKLAAQLESKGIHIPNGGTHWSDFVSATDRQRIVNIFDALPSPRAGKRKEPFERKVDPEEHNAQRMTLIDVINRGIDAAERELEIAQNSFDREDLERRIEDFYKAQFVLDGLKLNAPLPQTWRGLLKTED